MAQKDNGYHAGNKPFHMARESEKKIGEGRLATSNGYIYTQRMVW